MKLTKKTIVLLASAVLALIGFFMLFVSPMSATASVGGMTATESADFADVYFGVEEVKGAVGAFIGFLLILVAALALGAVAVKALLGKPFEEKVVRIINIAAIALLVVGAILVFLTKTMYLSANDIDAKTLEKLGLEYKLGAGPIVGGIFALLAAVGTGVSEFVLKD